MKRTWKVGESFNPYGTFVGSFIPNVLMQYQGLSATAKLLWARLAQHAGKGGNCYPSMETLSHEIGISHRQVKNLIRELVSQRFIKKESPGGIDRLKHLHCQYAFLWHQIFEKVQDNPDAWEKP